MFSLLKVFGSQDEKLFTVFNFYGNETHPCIVYNARTLTATMVVAECLMFMTVVDECRWRVELPRQLVNTGRPKQNGQMGCI